MIDERFCWLGQAESDLRESEAIDRHDRQRYEARIAEAEAHGWLTPDEAREALGRPRKGTTPGPAAPPTPASFLPGESERAAPEADGVETDRLAGQDSITAASPECGEAGDHTTADPCPVDLRPISRVLRIRWGGRG